MDADEARALLGLRGIGASGPGAGEKARARGGEGRHTLNANSGKILEVGAGDNSGVSPSREACHGSVTTSTRCPEAPSPRDWPEDSPHENGVYQNICVYCRLIFVGHKRRVVCRVCADRPRDPEAPTTQSRNRFGTTVHNLSSSGVGGESESPRASDTLTPRASGPRALTGKPFPGRSNSTYTPDLPVPFVLVAGMLSARRRR